MLEAVDHVFASSLIPSASNLNHLRVYLPISLEEFFSILLAGGGARGN